MRLFVCIFLAASSAAAVCPFDQGESWTDGFEGICLGMSFEQLLEIRPGTRKDPDYSPDRPHFPASESTEGHPGSGASKMLVLYQFENRKLASVVVLWFGVSDTFSQAKPRFLRFLLDSMGTDFKCAATTLRPGLDNEVQVPLLSWQSGAFRASAYAAEQKNSLGPEDMVYVFLIESPDVRESTVKALQDGNTGIDATTLSELFKKSGMPMNGDELQKMAEKPSEQEVDQR